MTTVDLTGEIIQEDIDHGVRGDCGKCPAARAGERATGCRCEVDECDITVHWPEGPRTYPVSYDLYEFIIAFDAGRPVSPMTFTIAVEEGLVEGVFSGAVCV